MEMISKAFDQFVTDLADADIFDGGDVLRGDNKRATLIRAPGCLVLPDIQYVRNYLNNSEEEQTKIIMAVANCFVITTGRKNENVAQTLATVENECMDYAYDLMKYVTANELVIDQDSNDKYDKWELLDIDWLDRSASLCIINVIFGMRLQI